jgi:hypothetical protein
MDAAGHAALPFLRSREFNPACEFKRFPGGAAILFLPGSIIDYGESLVSFAFFHTPSLHRTLSNSPPPTSMVGSWPAGPILTDMSM